MAEVIDMAKGKKEVSKVKKKKVKLSPKEALIKDLWDKREGIEQVICVIKGKNGSVSIAHSDVSFEMWCMTAKLLDYQISADLAEENKKK